MTTHAHATETDPDDAAAGGTPSWVADAVFYQIFPDRFADGDPSLDPEGMVPWSSRPSRSNYFGGDLRGIETHLDHLERLGANAIYLTPIFEADRSHRYDTADYLRIDHRLGDLAAFKRFLAAAHARGIRVVLDAVFNHCGEGHWAFRHVRAHGADSPYVDWFRVDAFPVVRDPEPNYATCSGCKYLPQFNHANPEVREYLFGVADYWTRLGIDGWRLDVPFLVTFDFWQEFRRRVKAVNPDLYIVAEVWEPAPEWVRGDTADGVMNYPLRDLIVDFAAGRSSSREFAAGVDELADPCSIRTAPPPPCRRGESPSSRGDTGGHTVDAPPRPGSGSPRPPVASRERRSGTTRRGCPCPGRGRRTAARTRRRRIRPQGTAPHPRWPR